MFEMNYLFIILLISVLVLYFFTFSHYILKNNIQRDFLRIFYNAVYNIYHEGHNYSHDASYYYDQLNLNYTKLTQDKPNNNFTGILDLLETIIYCYDSYSDKKFKNIYKTEKNINIKNFILKIHSYIREKDPFNSVPKKEAELLHSIKEALSKGDISSGNYSLKQLSQEIVAKENLLVQEKRNNQNAYIVSIVGIILTIAFGILSILPTFVK